MMGKRILTGFIVLIICACGRNGIPTTRAYKSIDDLLAALEDAGGEVIAVNYGAPLFEVNSREITLNGVKTELYEFESIDESEQGVIRLQEIIEDAGGNAANEFSSARIWSHGRLIIVYFGRDGGTILLLSGLLGDSLGESSAPADKPFPPAIPAAMQALAEALEISPTLIDVVSFETVVWPDSCLGYPEQGEECDEVEMQGWKILLTVDQRDFEIHTDELGLEVRFSP